jgi:DNA-binding NtrC family response regulator
LATLSTESSTTLTHPETEGSTRERGVGKELARKSSILIVDDEKIVCFFLQDCLQQAGYKAVTAGDGGSAIRAMEENSFDAVLLDYRLPDADGLDILQKIQGQYQDLPVIMMTSHSSVENAVASMKAGASDYLSKPFSREDILLRLERVFEMSRLQREVGRLKDEQLKRFGIVKVIGQSAAIQKVYQIIDRVMEHRDATVLIQGESGAGKDLLASVIHFGGPRADSPYMNITCTALPDTLLESELFGHEKGAFTDAKAQKKGLIELSDGGTLFLDEIGDMSLNLQSRLLRFLEEKAFRRVGGREDLHVDVRVIAATNRNLEQMVETGQFRQDLYFRLNVIPIFVPPLRERAEDIPLLVEFFITEYNRQFKKSVKGVTDDLMHRFEAYHWPGNIRELKNTIERAMILGNRETLGVEDLFESQVADLTTRSRFKLTREGINLEALEKDLLVQALKLTAGNQAEAGLLLGLNRDQVRYRVLKFGIQGPEDGKKEKDREKEKG